MQTNYVKFRGNEKIKYPIRESLNLNIECHYLVFQRIKTMRYTFFHKNGLLIILQSALYCVLYSY